MESSQPQRLGRTAGPRNDLELIAEAARRLAFDRPYLDHRHGHVSFQVLPTPSGPRVEYAIGERDNVGVTPSFGAYDLYPFPDPPAAA